MPSAPSQAPAAPSAGPVSIGGVMTVAPVATVLAERASLDAVVDQQQNQAHILELSAHIKTFWHQAEEAKRPIETQMIEAMYARRGEYTPEKLQRITSDGQTPIYMMLGSAKMRQVEALIRDVLIGAGTEKPWTILPTPNPELPPTLVAQAVQALTQEIMQVEAMGIPVSLEDARVRIREMRDMLDQRVREEARVRAERMEQKMEDQLVEGDYLDALDQFVTDVGTFKTAFMAGPIVRNKPKMSWGDDGELQVTTKLSLDWERVSPFDMYPAAWAKHINDGPLIRRHRLTREALYQLKGVEGYSNESIDKVLELYGQSGLKDWLAIDSELAFAEGKDHSSQDDKSGLIDALQFWGSASGKMLKEWSDGKLKVDDESKEYQIEAWLIGPYVIKAVLNSDPLARRPYYATSFQRVPGTIWGNSPYDLMKDCQDMCNAAARALAGNMGISSGPQVAILSNRLPAGEDVTSMFPWKIWQFESDPMGGTAQPIQFFQPNSNAQELMGVYEKFSVLADEYTGIPRYMAGFDSGGAGRTASGMSMMIGNASKVIRQVVGAIDFCIIKPMIERLYYYNMRYAEDPDLKGDVCVVARGAMSLQTKEAAQVRLAEFLQATGNPIDMQIVGLEGRGELLRSAVRRLDINPDKVVPPSSVLKMRALAMQMQQQAQAQQAQQQEPGPEGGQGERLMNEAPTTDHFEPQGA
jgi:hypothetical protein